MASFRIGAVRPRKIGLCLACFLALASLVSSHAAAGSQSPAPPNGAPSPPPAGPDPSAPGPASHPTIREIAEADLPSILMLVTYDSSGKPVALGSGFVIARGLVVTNVHVIAGASTVTALFHDESTAEVSGVAAADTDHDIAIVKVDTGGVKPLPLGSDGDLHVGDAVLALGNPKGLTGSVSSGIVSAIRDVDAGHVIQITAPISHGSSGGALVNTAGAVVGVTSFGFPDGENLNFAYGSRYLPPLLGKCSAKLLPWSAFPAVPDEEAPDPNQPDQQSPPSQGDGKTMVWVNTTSGIYHMPGTRYYGKTRHGKYMPEADARAKGYRPAANGR